jgi:hypothetical protein
VDFGDWQELSRLRSENHYWHRCILDILDALHKPSATTESVVEAVTAGIARLNEALARLRRRPVTAQR